MRALLPTLLPLALSLSCTTDSEFPLDVEQGTGTADGGKADDIRNVDRFDADEPLRSAALRDLVCTTIGAPAVSHCSELSHTVIEVASSTKFFHGDGDAITMELTVATHDAVTGADYEVVLTRFIDNNHRLRFRAEIRGDSLADVHRFIAALADEAGEFPDWHDAAFTTRARIVGKGDLSAAVATRADAELAARAVLNDEGSVGAGGAEFAGETPFVEIRRDGEVIGYVVGIDDVIDHPLWDGSGVHLYFDRHGTVVTDTEWSG